MLVVGCFGQLCWMGEGGRRFLLFKMSVVVEHARRLPLGLETGLPSPALLCRWAYMLNNGGLGTSFWVVHHLYRVFSFQAADGNKHSVLDRTASERASTVAG